MEMKTFICELGHRLQQDSEQAIAQNRKCIENDLFCEKKDAEHANSLIAIQTRGGKSIIHTVSQL